MPLVIFRWLNQRNITHLDDFRREVEKSIASRGISIGRSGFFSAAGSAYAGIVVHINITAL
jgi:hypothetical protein